MVSGHSFADSTRRYEAWLAQYCKIDDAGLAEKREKIKAAPFPFLRGTFYRWPHHFAAVEPRIAEAARILSIGDTHIENFGTWRDEEGRHAWGVNDFDEAAELPWTSDLVRLATSVILAADAKTRCGESLRARFSKAIGKAVEDRTLGRSYSRRTIRSCAISRSSKARQPVDSGRSFATSARPARFQPRSSTSFSRASRPRREASNSPAGLRVSVASVARATSRSPSGMGASSRARPRPQRHRPFTCDEAEGRDQVLDHRRIRALAFQPRDPAFRLTREWILRRLSPEGDKIELDRIEKLFKDEPEKARKGAFCS